MQDFPQFQYEQQNQQKEQKSIKELQSIYCKKIHKSQKKQRQLQQISFYNKHSIKNVQNSSDTTQNQNKSAQNIEVTNLLNQNQQSFKSIQKMYSQISIAIHSLYILTLILILKQHLWFRILQIIIHSIVIIINITHYFYKPSKNPKLFKLNQPRSNFLLFQIIYVVLANLTAFFVLLIEFKSAFLYILVLLCSIDILFIQKLRKLLKIQKNMDMDMKTSNVALDSQDLFQRSDKV